MSSLNKNECCFHVSDAMLTSIACLLSLYARGRSCVDSAKEKDSLVFSSSCIDQRESRIEHLRGLASCLAEVLVGLGELSPNSKVSDT